MTYYAQSPDAATLPATIICVIVQLLIIGGGYLAMKAITKKHDA